MSVLVYNGKGSDAESRKFLFESLNAVIDKDHHTVDYITPQAIKEGLWLKNCSVIIFGGGYDRGFESAVGRDGAQKIREFVINGGHYLGLCAGAYWACDHIEFDKGGPLEVTGERFLKFFPGICVGPAFPGFQYNSKQGVQAVPVRYGKSETFHAYMHGGGYFMPYLDAKKSMEQVPQPKLSKLQHNKRILVETHQSTAISAPLALDSSKIPRGSSLLSPHLTLQPRETSDLSIYAEQSHKDLGIYCSLESKAMAIVQCSVGRGTAILSGVHLEFPFHLLDKENPHMKSCIPHFSHSEDRRQFVFKDILKQLGVQVRTCKAAL
ncbi:unnamed protein product [Lymnaea stagnalis]|uniref:Biotin-protein ligase N-terminal domain-containing protein n=1 Tax=Lymnaea stagnalis TaxID=6523 RepID=A0AAV2I482_LYMST